MHIVKAHAYGNDFLLVPEDDLGTCEPTGLTRTLCARQTGVGADGVIFYRGTSDGAAMRLFNADGSASEVSGNGVRCLAAWLLARGALRAEVGHSVSVDTAAGAKRLWVVGREQGRYLFRAAMGQPTEVRERDLDVDCETLRVVTLRVGNPQCVVLGGASTARLDRYGRALATHAAFPEGSNVAFVAVDATDRLRVLIWERGVGPTRSSGTGACAAAVAAAVYGGAARDVSVESPGGTQRVEWRDEGIFLTGWAEVVMEGRWLADQERTATPRT